MYRRPSGRADAALLYQRRGGPARHMDVPRGGQRDVVHGRERGRSSLRQRLLQGAMSPIAPTAPRPAAAPRFGARLPGNAAPRPMAVPRYYNRASGRMETRQAMRAYRPGAVARPVQRVGTPLRVKAPAAKPAPAPKPFVAPPWP